MKKTIALAGTTVLFVAGLLFLSGCRNAVTPALPTVGSVTIGITGEDDFLRTITPDTVLGDFDRIDLVFTPVPTGTAQTVVWTDATVEIPLTAGTWSLQIEAFIEDPDDPGEYLLAATGSTVNADGTARATFPVVAGDNTYLDARLSPIVAGSGTFSWDIDLDPSITAATARFVPLTGATIPSAFLPYFDLYAQRVSPAPVEWPAGSFQVFVNLVNGSGEDVEIGPIIMRVYQNLESVFEESFTLANFPRTVFDMIMTAWEYSVANEWNFTGAGITLAHFDFLGIEMDSTLALLTPHFNYLAYEFDPPANPVQLAEMVDAAEIMQSGFDFTQFTRHDDAEEDMQDLVDALNESILYFDWVVGPVYQYTVTVEVGSGVYEVVFDPFYRLDGTVVIDNAALTGYTVGDTLTANVTVTAGSPGGTNEFQWLRTVGTADPVGIGTDADTYMLAIADVGGVITVTVTRADHFGALVSPPTGTVEAAPVGPGSGSITITFQDWNGITAIPGPTFSILGTPETITIAQPGLDLSSVTWYIRGSEVGDEPTLTLDDDVHGDRLGTHVLTVNATINGRRYSAQVSFTTTL